jgi:hypothetical protein
VSKKRFFHSFTPNNFIVDHEFHDERCFGAGFAHATLSSKGFILQIKLNSSENI